MSYIIYFKLDNYRYYLIYLLNIKQIIYLKLKVLYTFKSKYILKLLK